MEWYYAKDGNQQGPISMAQLKQLASAGRLDPTDMVFKTGTTDWVEASTVAGLFAAARSAPAAAPPAAEGGFAFGEEKAVAAPARRKGARARVEKQEEEVEDAPRPRFEKAGGGGSISDLLAFRRMVAPTVIMVIFWIGVAGSVLGGLSIIFVGISSGSVLGMVGGLVLGLLSIPVSILLVRLYCELMIVIFRMNETLTDIKNLLERQRES